MSITSVTREFRAVFKFLDSDYFPEGTQHVLALPKRTNYGRWFPFIFLHLVCLGVFWVGFSPFSVGFAIILYLVRMFAITAFYHRYFSHRTFKTGRIAQFIFALVGLTAVQRGPLWWAAHHRKHHRYADKEKDVHSPVEDSFLWAHIGWITSDHNMPTDYDQVKDLTKFPELVWLNRFDWLVPVLSAIAIYFVGAYLESVAPVMHVTGAQLVVWSFVSTVCAFHATASINSVAHLFGTRRFDTNDDSRNNFLLAMFTLGEGWHNNHHRYPSSAKQGIVWWEIDISYYVLRLMESFGIIWDLQTSHSSTVAVAGKQAKALSSHPVAELADSGYGTLEMETLAIVGSGIAGMGSAYLLRNKFQITIFEKDKRIGGHTNTVVVEEDGTPVPIDTGFMVYNEATYPNLTKLFAALSVATKPTDMSFSVQQLGLGFEWSGTGYERLFGDRSNLFKLRFWRFLLKLDKFNKEALMNVANPEYNSLSVRDYVDRLGYGNDFLDLYLLPMMSALWSASPRVMLSFPIASLLRFMRSHGLLSMYGQHQWLTVDKGSGTYMEKLQKLLPGAVRVNCGVRTVTRRGGKVLLVTEEGAESNFDKCIIASHADQAANMLVDKTDEENATLSAFQYQSNVATLHTYPGVMPKHKQNWASWNYRLQPRSVHQRDVEAMVFSGALVGREEKSRENIVQSTSGRGVNAAAIKHPVTMATDDTENELETSTHYWMNSLQNVSKKKDYFISIGGAHLIPESYVLSTIDYEHPIFTVEALKSQERLNVLNSRAEQSVFFAGSYFRYGFHEDAFNSAVQVSELLGGEPGWKAV